MTNPNPIEIVKFFEEYYICREKDYEGECDFDEHEYLHQDGKWYETTWNYELEDYNAYFPTREDAETFLMAYYQQILEQKL